MRKARPKGKWIPRTRGQWVVQLKLESGCLPFHPGFLQLLQTVSNQCFRAETEVWQGECALSANGQVNLNGFKMIAESLLNQTDHKADGRDRRKRQPTVSLSSKRSVQTCTHLLPRHWCACNGCHTGFSYSEHTTSTILEWSLSVLHRSPWSLKANDLFLIFFFAFGFFSLFPSPSPKLALQFGEKAMWYDCTFNLC